MQPASELLAESKVLGEGKKGKKPLSAVAARGKGGRKHHQSCRPRQEGRKRAGFITEGRGWGWHRAETLLVCKVPPTCFQCLPAPRARKADLSLAVQVAFLLKRARLPTEISPPHFSLATAASLGSVKLHQSTFGFPAVNRELCVCRAEGWGER